LLYCRTKSATQSIEGFAVLKDCWGQHKGSKTVVANHWLCRLRVVRQETWSHSTRNRVSTLWCSQV